MGVIFIRCQDGDIAIAQGGLKRTLRLFFSQLDELVFMAVLLGGELHFAQLDRDAWQQYQQRNYKTTIV